MRDERPEVATIAPRTPPAIAASNSPRPFSEGIKLSKNKMPIMLNQIIRTIPSAIPTNSVRPPALLAEIMPPMKDPVKVITIRITPDKLSSNTPERINADAGNRSIRQISNATRLPIRTFITYRLNPGPVASALRTATTPFKLSF